MLINHLEGLGITGVEFVLEKAKRQWQNCAVYYNAL